MNIWNLSLYAVEHPPIAIVRVPRPDVVGVVRLKARLFELALEHGTPTGFICDDKGPCKDLQAIATELGLPFCVVALDGDTATLRGAEVFGTDEPAKPAKRRRQPKPKPTPEAVAD